MKLVFPGGEHPQVLLSQGGNRVGSAGDAAVVLDRPSMPAVLCKIIVSDGGVLAQVPANAAVTVNGRHVEGVIALRVGDVIGFDGVCARLVPLASPSMHHAFGNLAGVYGQPDQAAGVDDPQLTVVRAAVPRCVLRGISGPVFGRSYPVIGPTTIGRAPECTLRIDEEGISRLHARLLPHATGLRLEDAGSTNGCYVNGTRVESAQVLGGDEIMLDTLRFQLIVMGQRSPAAIPVTPPARPVPRRWPLWTAAGLLLIALLSLAALA